MSNAIGRSDPPTGASRAQVNAGILLAVVLVLLGAWTLHRFLAALVWAAIFAIALWPLYRRAQGRWPPTKHNILVPALFTLTVALLFLIPLTLVALQVGREGYGLLAMAREAQRHGIPVPDWVTHLPFLNQAATTWWQANLADPSGAADLLGRVGRDRLFTFGRAFGLDLAHRAVLFGFTLLTLFFLFRDGAALSAQMLRASQIAFGPRGERIALQIVASVKGTVDGLVLVGLAEGFLMGVAYAVTGVPHPALLGAVTALAAMVPFAAPLVFAIAAVILIAQAKLAAAIGVFALGMVVVFIADHFVRPVLIGGATRLPFLWVLLGILGGVEVWGLLGLFLGPAIMAALVLLWREWTDGGDTQAATRPAMAVPAPQARIRPVR